MGEVNVTTTLDTDSQMPLSDQFDQRGSDFRRHLLVVALIDLLRCQKIPELPG
jgi:hypothetical protein